jgi:hypothetical protein
MTHETNSVRWHLAGSALLASLLLVTPTSSYTGPRFPQSTLLSANDIEEAIARGQNGEVTPYLISGLGGGGGSKAAIYTPFTRVALATIARLLTFDGTTILFQGAPQWTASPEVLVVFTNPCPGEPRCEFGGVAVDPIVEHPTRIYIQQQVTQGPSPVTLPIRVLPLNELRWLGTISVEEPLVAATFSAEAFRAGAKVAAEWGHWDSVTFIVGGYLGEAELSTWR